MYIYFLFFVMLLSWRPGGYLNDDVVKKIKSFKMCDGQGVFGGTGNN